MAEALPLDDNAIDSPADEAIAGCLNLDAPVSFFLFAGAGSGKTRSLVKALRLIKQKFGRRLQVKGQRIGVITYTNAACDEIKQRLDFDPLIEVSTIHSFVWSLIGSFHADLRVWLKTNLKLEIAELEEQNSKGRASKASQDRTKSIESKQKRLAGLDSIRRFTYNPNGDNVGRDSLNHSEVIKICADFLGQKPLMRLILVSKFPILLVDESQDTNKLLMEAFLAVQLEKKQAFCLGLFGDTMQRIYTDGKTDLGQNLPGDWAKPAKIMNHRCPKRVVRLVNKIRSVVDTQEQRPRNDAREGFARLFIVPSNKTDKLGVERGVGQRMAEVTKDQKWAGASPDIKCLILEHHMAARRMGFFEPEKAANRPKFRSLSTERRGLTSTNA